MNDLRTKLHLLRILFARTSCGQELRFRIIQLIYRFLPIPKSIKIPIRDIVKRILKAPIPEDYERWVHNYDTLTDQDCRQIKKNICNFAHRPLISILMPVYNTPERILTIAIQSVQNQLYPDWELCIADDCSTNPKVRELLQAFTNQDSRIKVVFRSSNGHISAASNSALELATGDYIALMDHDDTLAMHALYWVASEINKHPNAMLIYSDEDKIDLHGERYSPFFKPDWNPMLILGQNYINHLGVYQRKRAMEIGGFRHGFEGSQDWDFVLRFTEGLSAEQIRHISAVLYHWRVLPNSTSFTIHSKTYAISAGKKAVTEALTRRLGNEPFDLEDAKGRTLGHFLPRFKVKGCPLVSILIPTRNGLDLIRPCLESLARTEYRNYEIVIVDNQSDNPETLQYLSAISKQSHVRVLRYDFPFNYAAMHNWAVPQTKGEYICLLNNDTEVISPHWLSEMLALAQRPGAGAVGAKLLYPDDTVQHNGTILGFFGVADHMNRGKPSNYQGYYGRSVLLQNFSAVTAACLLVRKSHWEEVGGMTSELAIAFNDVDFCLKLREKGWENVWTPEAKLFHHESKSRGHDIGKEKRLRFSLEIAYMQWRWGPLLLFDPAYNPNFSLQEDFGLAYPPRRIRPWRQDFVEVDVPYGNPSCEIPPLVLEPGKKLRGSFPLPRGLKGELAGIKFFIKLQGGQYMGTVHLTVQDGQSGIGQGRAIIGPDVKYNAPIDVVFSDSRISLLSQQRLHFSLSLEDTNVPLQMNAFLLNKMFGQQIEEREEVALRMILLLEKT